MATGIQHVTDPSTANSWNDAVLGLLPQQGGWTEEEYLVLTAHSNRLVEFTDGCLEFLPMPTDKHQAISAFLFMAFRAFFDVRGGKVRYAPLRMRVRRGKVREPDLMLLLSAADPRRQNALWEGADLVLEIVSPDKPERDLVDKRRDYAEARIPEYWIVDPLNETITVLRLAGEAYEEAGVYHRGQLATSALRPEFSLAVAATFDAE